MQTLLQDSEPEAARKPPAQPAANDNIASRLPAALPAFPHDAVVRIERPARSAMTSAPSEPQDWRLVFEPRSRPFVDPLMGWTGSRDPLAQVELWFPTLEAAVSYARRQGLHYVVRHDARSRRASERRAHRRRSFSDATLRRLGLGGLQATYGDAMAYADKSPPPPAEPSTRQSAMDVVRDPNLSVDDKRSILMNRAYDEYLLDQRASDAGESRWSRLRDIERALQELESASRAAADDGQRTRNRAAR